MRRRDVRRTRHRVLPWFSSLSELDRARPVGFDAEPRPSYEQMTVQVREQVTALLPGAVDEGSAAVLDPTVAAWARGRLSEVDTDHVDHLAVVERLVGMARERVAITAATAAAATQRLAAADLDLTAARARLGLPAAPSVPTTPSAPSSEETR